MMMYPNVCSRCGLCCIVTACPIALERVPGAKKNERCPSLKIDDEGQATCKIFQNMINAAHGNRFLCNKLANVFGIGKGCCIKASACQGQKELDFASLPPDAKRLIVKRHLKK